jgi:hypothetical protein
MSTFLPLNGIRSQLLSPALALAILSSLAACGVQAQSAAGNSKVKREGARAASETTFSCKEKGSDNVGALTLNRGGNKNEIFWEEAWHSSSSKGRYRGIEPTQLREWFGYKKFELTDFFSSQDDFFTTEISSYFLALKEVNAEEIDVFVYFDNQDRPEEITKYSCVKSQR